MGQLAKAIPTVNFEVGRSQLTYSVNRIIKLINDSIESGNPITAQDVREAYCDFAMTARRHRAGLVWVPEKGNYRYAKTRKEWMDNYCKEYKAIQ